MKKPKVNTVDGKKELLWFFLGGVSQKDVNEAIAEEFPGVHPEKIKFGFMAILTVSQMD